MPKSWTPEEVRNWILKTLYDIYMGSPTASVSWSIFRGVFKRNGEDPAWEDIYRECEWLKWKGFIEAQFEPGKVSDARITPAGREYVEQNLLKSSSSQKSN